MEKKRVLLVAGAGTLGTYTYAELLRLGYAVDVMCLEDYHSTCRDLHFINGYVTDELLKETVEKTHYAAIVDFLVYADIEQFKKRAVYYMEHTDQYVFLSSYRVYANEAHPVREDSPQLLDVIKDETYLQTESYAIPKAKSERFLRECGYHNYTIVRPQISFSHLRFDLITQGTRTVLLRSLASKPILLPESCRDKIAGLGWAGNTGKLMANLIGKADALGEDFTVADGTHYSWGEIADMYTEVLGSRFVWVDDETYLNVASSGSYMQRCMLYTDRIYDRDIDNSKILRVSGVDKSELVSITDGLRRELLYLIENPERMKAFYTESAEKLNQKIDEWFENQK